MESMTNNHYRIPPSFFNQDQSQAGPSSRHQRQHSHDDHGFNATSSAYPDALTEAEIYGDADEGQIRGVYGGATRYDAALRSPYQSRLDPMASSGPAHLPSSPSTSSLRGKRAAPPAALDLSPRPDRSRYDHLGLGQTSNVNRRVVTDSYLERPAHTSPPRVSRPLPALPPGASPRVPPYRTSYMPPVTAPTAPFIPTSPSMPLSVPLSAFGHGFRHRQTSNVYSSIYDPQPPPTSSAMSPVSPSNLDPSVIDRGNLVGVGELATPRWAQQPLYPHPKDTSPPVPSQKYAVGSAPTDWAAGEVGLGLGVGMDTNKAHRSRHHSVYSSPPKVPFRGSSREARSEPQTATEPEFSSLLGSLQDFSFDSSMEAALAASLAIPDEPPAPQQQQSVSPGSARSRTYARRLQREKERERQLEEVSGLRHASKLSPPTSADSIRRDPRKTPPSKDARSSHDLLKHFAPKDFSHLPPSPSTASINQFLRGSSSINNLGGTPPTSMSPSTSYFTRTLKQSDSMQNVDAETAEALRKLDGISHTPKSRTKSKAPSASSRSGTPPPSKSKADKMISAKPGVTSLKDDGGSPSNGWVDLSDELPAVPTKPIDIEQRESTSSTGLGTPTSRDSTLATTPSSASGVKVAGRRASAGSDTSSSLDGPHDKPGAVVPPVPPLPKGYASMRPSYVPLQEESSTPLESPPDRPKGMTKKWSFSSSFNLRIGKDSPVSPPVLETSKSPEWSDQHLSPNTDKQDPEFFDSRSHLSITPVAQLPSSSQKRPPAKRSTPSAIPFFRRTSSSSVVKPVEAPVGSPPAQRTPSGNTRKSVLGMHLPSMLRGSSSKRGLSQQVQPENVEPTKEPREIREPASVGWNGRQRGKTLSMSADQAAAIMAGPEPALRPKPSVDGSLTYRESSQSIRSYNTLNGAQHTTTIRAPKEILPAIAGSPALKPAASTSSLREPIPPSATPTRIPRIANRPAGSPSMPPPALPLPGSRSGMMHHSKTMSGTASMADMTRGVSEFGIVSAPRQASSGAHRAKLLAPMSSSREINKPRPVEVPRANVPLSRRTLPNPPAAAAGTISSNAKRASKEIRPAVRRDSKDAPSDSDKGSRATSPIKPSKSLHSKLVVPSTSRIPSSSSVGAPGMRKALVDPSPSPAEDEEAMADAEMMAYIARRRAKAEAKKDDMADVNEFPTDIEPVEPMSQRTYLRNNLAKMSDYERKEVLDFELIYFAPSVKISRPAQANGATYNYGHDDERGDYLVVDGDHLCYRYEVIGILGKGSFGQVLQCRDHRTGLSVAVKIIRNKKRFHAQALVEVKILAQLVEWVGSCDVPVLRAQDPDDKHNMVQMTDHFYFRNHLCIVTELLSINLYELIKANSFAGFSTVLIRRMTTQMLSSLQLMRSHRVVHCDMKPENILLRHPMKSGIKVIDFGSSCLETEKVYTYIQSRFYRSPEVILGMNYAMAIDMWSLGCILAELYTGVPIFPGENEHEQLACIMEVLGVPERHILDRSSRRKLFFDATGAPRPFVNGKGKRRRPGTRTLAQILKCNDELFVDFIAKCLTFDPDRRLKPQPALRHPWILAGRKRMPSNLPEKRASSSQSTTTSRSNSGYLVSAPSSAMNTNGSGIGGAASRDKSKQLLISPPTPLMARQTGQVASAPRIGHTISISSSKLSQPITRNGSFMNSTTRISQG